MAQICDRCSFKDNPDEMSFCGRCGAPLGVRCPNCGLRNPPRQPVCRQCSSPLPEISPLAEAEDAHVWEAAKRYLPMGVIEKLTQAVEGYWGDRRDVTVLFADLCDYTALSEAFDPELVYGLLNAVLEVLIKEIHRFEGVINQFRGDGLMATFGIPLAHENDPERAVWAALGMQKALLELNREVEPRLGVTVKMRIGINHGEVIAGSIGSEERKDFTIIGSAVNLAARLEHAAEPGSVLVSRSIYQRTYRLFEFQARPLLELKGVAGPVENWLAIGPKAQPAPVRGLEGLSARMIGRGEELDALCATASDLVKNNTGKLILVTGEAGIGKSRLVTELKASLAAEPISVLEGACQAHTSATAYSLFVSLLESCMDLPPTGSEDRRTTLDVWLNEHIPDRASMLDLYLSHLLDLPLTQEDASDLLYLEPSQLQQQVFIAVRDLLSHLAGQQPVVVILEDLHWVDNTSLELLMFLVPIVQQMPLALCGISRPLSGQAAPRLKELGATRLAERFLLIELNPLSVEETGFLMADLLTSPALPDSWRQAILERVRGNPFFLEEFIRILIDGGYITWDEEEQTGDGRWVAVQDVALETLRVPQTLQELVMARVDRLPAGSQLVLTCASVLGQRFDRGLLTEVVDAEQCPALDTHLQYLCAYDFLSLHAEAEEVYHFKHVIVQEAVYGSLLGEAQREYHRRAGQGLEKLYAEQLDEHLEQLAYHYSRSGLATKAVPYLTQAAARDARRYANNEALQHFDEALVLFPSLPSVRQRNFELEITVGRGDVYFLIGRYADAQADYWRGLGVLHGHRFDSPTSALSLAVQRKMGQCWERQGDYAQAMLWYQLALADTKARETTMSAEIALEQARLYNDIGWLHFRRNELDEAEEWLRKALQLVEGTEHRREIATIHNRMGGVWFRRGDLIKASQEVAAALVLYEYMNDLQGIARGYANLGVLAETQGQWNEAAICFRRSLETHERTGDIQGATIASCNLGVVYTDLGDIPQAKQFLERSLQGALATADNFNAARAYQNLGRACLYAREWSLAEDYLRRALASYEELENRDLLADTLELMGEAVLGSGDLHNARALAERSLEMALQGERGREEREARAWRLMGMVQRAQGELDQAMESLLKSRQMFDDQGLRLEQAQVLLELAFLFQALGQEVEARRVGEECRVLSESIGTSLIQRWAEDLLTNL